MEVSIYVDGAHKCDNNINDLWYHHEIRIFMSQSIIPISGVDQFEAVGENHLKIGIGINNPSFVELL